MALPGKHRDRKKRGGEVAILVASLLLAFVIWVAHNLTQDYFSYRQYRITVVTSLPGFASESESEEILVAGGDAKGYDIIGRRSRKARNAESITIEVDPKYFTRDIYRSDLFTVKARDIQETLNQKVGTEFNITYVPDQKLSFVFSRQSNRKVPVVLSESRISCKPQYMIHGHVHSNYGSKFKRRLEHPSGTTIINACDKYFFDYDTEKRNEISRFQLIKALKFKFM